MVRDENKIDEIKNRPQNHHTYVYIIIDLFVDTPQGGVKYKNEGWYNIISLYNILISIDISPSHITPVIT